MPLTQISQEGAKDEAINEAKLQISNAGSDGQFLSKQSGNTGGLTWATPAGGSGGATGLDLDDDVKLRLGTGNDLEIYHDGNDSYINNDTGELYIRRDDVRLQSAGGESYFQGVANGSAYLYYNNSVAFQTDTNGVQVLGTEGNDASLYLFPDEADDLADQWRIRAFASSQMLRIESRNGSGTYESNISCNGDGAVELYHNAAKKLETTSAGVSVTGDLTVSGSSPGVNYISQWSHAGFAANADTSGDLTSNWSEFNQSNMGHTKWSLLGTSMTESSGIFKFPSKGHWLITYSLAGYHDDTSSRIAGNRIYLSTNGGSSWTQVAHGQWNTWDATGVDNGVCYGQCYCSVVLDITSDVNDGTPFQVKFYYQTEGAMQVSGGDSGNNITFIKLADT